MLTPVFWRWTRPLALVLLVGLHGSIAAMVNLGIFSAAMIAYDPFLLDTAQWALFARLVPRKRPRAHRVLRRRLRRLLLPGARAGAPGRVPAPAPGLATSDRRRCTTPPTSIRELLDRTLLVVDPRRAGAPLDARRRVAEILRALPFGGLWSWPLRLPGLSALANAAYDAFARNRTRISTWLGLAACGVPGAPRPGGAGAAA